MHNPYTIKLLEARLRQQNATIEAQQKIIDQLRQNTQPAAAFIGVDLAKHKDTTATTTKRFTP